MQENYNVLIANDGEEALYNVKQFYDSIGLVLMDNQMP